MEVFKSRLKKLYEIIKKPEMEILPGHLAFFLVLSIVPIILLFALIASQFSISMDVVNNFVNSVLPEEVSSILVPFFSGDYGYSAIFLMIFGLFIASNGLYSVIVASNALYEDFSKHFLRRRLKSIILTIFLMFLFIFMVVVMAFGDSIMLLIKEQIDADLIFDYLNIFYVLIKWPFAFIYIFFIISLIYAIAPDKKIKSRAVLTGSLFTTVTWIITTYLYSYYVANFANYSVIYGSLSNIVVLMIWIYILSYLFIVGIAINASKYTFKSKEVLNEGLN